jgi:hypothetical protein
MTTKEEHEHNFQQMQKIAAQCFLHQGEHAPQIMNLTKDGEMQIVLVVGMDDDEQKDKVAEMMVRFVEDGSQAVAFITEAWTVCQTDLDEGQNCTNVRPSQHPNRKEILMVTYSTPFAEWVASADIIREETDPWGGRMSDLQENLRLSEWTRMEIPGMNPGRFTNIWRKARGKHFQEN